jgi:predicted aspartyl protease
MVTGKFEGTDKQLPMVPAVILWEQSVQTPYFVLDTGFTGDLVVTSKIARDLGLKVDGVTKAENANGGIVALPSASAIAFMEGEKLLVTVIISDSRPLLGISFLEKFQYKAIIDCKYKTVELNRVL